MLKKLNVYYNGWGEYWLWGTLVSSTAITGRPLIAFEYSAEAISKGLELSSYLLPLKGDPLRTNFHAHQMGLPGPISVSYTHLTLPTTRLVCRSRWSPYH